ncbi:MAG: LCP family protein, partial [Acidimicrobiales bacterium]
RTIQTLPRIPIGASQLLSPQVEPGEPQNFLLVGSDSAARLDEGASAAQGRDLSTEAKRSRADTMMLLRVDPATGSAAVLSLPRDLWVPINGKEQKLNAAFLEGPDLLVETVKSYFDVDVHHYLQVDFAGFARVIDSIGGVPIYFKNPTRDLRSGLDIEQSGCVTLDGNAALSYVRSRKYYQEFIDDAWRSTDGKSDLDRTARQRDFLILALEQTVDRTGRNPLEIRGLINAVTSDGGSLGLDDTLSIQDLLDLGNIFANFDPESLQRFELPVTDDRIVTELTKKQKRQQRRQQKAAEQGEAGDNGVVADNDDEELSGLQILRVDLSRKKVQAVLDVFRGNSGFDRPADVEIRVSQGSGSPEQVGDAVDNLRERGFTVLNSGRTEASTDTAIRFSPEASDHAELATRFLAVLPDMSLTTVESETIELIVGADFTGIRFLPRPENEVRELFATLLASTPDINGDENNSTTTSPTTISPSSLATTTSVEVRGHVPQDTTCR